MTKVPTPIIITDGLLLMLQLQETFSYCDILTD